MLLPGTCTKVRWYRAGTPVLLLSDETLSESRMKINNNSFTPIVTSIHRLQLLHFRRHRMKSFKKGQLQEKWTLNCRQLRVHYHKLQYWFFVQICCARSCTSTPVSTSCYVSVLEFTGTPVPFKLKFQPGSHNFQTAKWPAGYFSSVPD
jgi:hypothetical protein